MEYIHFQIDSRIKVLYSKQIVPIAITIVAILREQAKQEPGSSLLILFTTSISKNNHAITTGHCKPMDQSDYSNTIYYSSHHSLNKWRHGLAGQFLAMYMVVE